MPKSRDPPANNRGKMITIAARMAVKAKAGSEKVKVKGGIG
jgi:hypothetical protein